MMSGSTPTRTPGRHTPSTGTRRRRGTTTSLGWFSVRGFLVRGGHSQSQNPHGPSPSVVEARPFHHLSLKARVLHHNPHALSASPVGRHGRSRRVVIAREAIGMIRLIATLLAHIATVV